MQRAAKGLSARRVSPGMAQPLPRDATPRATSLRPARREPPTGTHAALPPLPRAGPLAAGGALPGYLWGALHPQLSPGRGTSLPGRSRFIRGHCGSVASRGRPPLPSGERGSRQAIVCRITRRGPCQTRRPSGRRSCFHPIDRQVVIPAGRACRSYPVPRTSVC